MRKQLAALIVAGSAVAALIGAPAAHAADTSTTFVLSASGTLAISVPASVQLSAGTATNAGSLTAFTATATVGNTGASWHPTVVITIPSSAVIGTYAGTITHSAA